MRASRLLNGYEKKDMKEIEERMLLKDRYNKKSYPTHTLTHTENLILTAKPNDEPDRANIQWPEIKWKRKRGKTTFKPKKKKPLRKTRHQLEEILCRAGRQIEYCEECGQFYGDLQIHHIDGNPHNNHPDNLAILCGGCHAEKHRIADERGVKDWSIGTKAVTKS